MREGPVIAENIVNSIQKKPLKPYVPQRSFLALMMTGDEKCIGSKYGITFTGRWVWRMKDHIDVSFMNLFSPYFLFKDYDTKGTAEPVVNTALFDTEDPQTAVMKAKVAQMSAEEAG